MHITLVLASCLKFSSYRTGKVSRYFERVSRLAFIQTQYPFFTSEGDALQGTPLFPSVCNTIGGGGRDPAMSQASRYLNIGPNKRIC